MAILMADLSGYTAFTEIHGAVQAADLIEKYVRIEEASLVGESRLQERTGDEVMIVSASPDSLLATAVMITKNTSGEDNFLQVHGGLHYGKILYRNNSYFGSSINLTARIASVANPGSFWCSTDFINALADSSIFKKQPKQRHRFKNVSEEKELSKVPAASSASFYIDPICRMQVLDTDLAIPHPADKHLFFCAHACLDSFTLNTPHTRLQG